jgi:hypothetical protein
MKISATNRLKIIAYSKFEKGTLKSQIATYEVQLNPTEVSCSFAKEEQENQEPLGANGDQINNKRPSYYKESIKFNFTLDVSGAVPNSPDGLSAFTINPDLKLTIEKLKKATIYPIRSSHAPPFVHIIWGDISLKGIVNDFSIDYTYFDFAGKAMRAKVSMGVVEVVDSVVETSKYQSPDITRMPVIQDGQTLIGLCREFYDSGQHYISVAQVNDLASFRRLIPGQRLIFPPIQR